MIAATRARPVPARASLADLLSLTKPRINLLVLCTTATGIGLAPGHVEVWRAVVALVCTALVVGGANALNCYWERDTDALMLRTRDRPLPAGRVEPAEGLLVGLLLVTFSIPLLALVVNAMTGLLALVALGSYVWIYTPLKRVTPLALLVGAVPGAIPPLLGWTAVTGRLDPGGLWLFGLMFVWQLPHFLAIALYLKEDYARGGLRVTPLVLGETFARRELFAWTLGLLPVSLGLFWVGLGGRVYAGLAAAMWLGFLFFAARSLRASDGVETQRAGRRVFAYSIVYLVVLLGAVLLDHPVARAPAGEVATSQSVP